MKNRFAIFAQVTGADTVTACFANLQGGVASEPIQMGLRDMADALAHRDMADHVLVVTTDPVDANVSAFIQGLGYYMKELPSVFYASPFMKGDTDPASVADKIISSDLFDIICKV